MMKTVDEFLNVLEEFPTVISDVIGNGWCAGDILSIANEIRMKLNLALPPSFPNTFGALPPKESPWQLGVKVNDVQNRTTEEDKFINTLLSLKGSLRHDLPRPADLVRVDAAELLVAEEENYKLETIFS